MAAIPALLLFLVLHGLFFHDVVLGDRTLSAATLTAGLTPRGPVDAPAERTPPHVLDVEGAAWVDEPSPYLARRAIAAGELPLWSSDVGLGAPLAANLNSGAANPLQWPLNLWPGPRAADAYYLARLLLLALATWALLRELALGSLAAAVGASVVAYGGYPLAWLVHHPLATEVHLPLMLLGFERGRRGRPAGWMLLGVAAGGALLGGKLQASLLCFAFTAVHAAVRGRDRAGGAGAATTAATAVGLALGGLLAGVLLAPAAELMARASGLTLGGRGQLAGYTLPWPSLASLAAPRLFSAPGHAFPDGLLTPGIGVAAILLAAVGVAANGSPLVGVARAAALWSALLLARNVGVFGDLAARLPVVRGILFVKYTFTIVFALALAAAIGLDAIVRGRVERRRAFAAGVGTLLICGGLVAAAVASDAPPARPAALVVPALAAATLAIAAILWRRGVLGGRMLGGVSAALVVAELWAAAPHVHPPRLAPYRPPAFVDFLRGAGPGRILADPDLAVPLTSAAAGLADLRAIDVLTPGTYYAFFTRLVSFCDRVIHFTVDPDVAVAATAPAADLVGVRWIATRHELPPGDLAARVRAAVGRERTARLFAGMTALRVDGGPLAIGPLAVGEDARFAFTLPTPFMFEVGADSEAPELAFGALVRGPAASVALRVQIDGLPSDASGDPTILVPDERWYEQRIALARAGERRRLRLRVSATTTDGRPATVSLGNLGFGPGAANEARLATERVERQAREATALRRVFADPAEGVVVYENTNALPRAFRVGRVEPTGSEEAALTRLGDGFDFRAAALIDQREVAAVEAALTAAARTAEPAAGTTMIRTETPGSVTVATDGETPALLVLADLAYPGWRAEVDGRAAVVRTVDGVLRGVAVPAGAHVVTFRYRPSSLWLGAVLSLVGAIALLPWARASARAHGDRGA
jgi:hypothetical protein